MFYCLTDSNDEEENDGMTKEVVNEEINKIGYCLYGRIAYLLSYVIEMRTHCILFHS